eukprot:1430882-Rhodomonas_salina.1
MDSFTTLQATAEGFPRRRRGRKATDAAEATCREALRSGNLDKMRQAFPQVPIDILQDFCSPPPIGPYGGLTTEEILEAGRADKAHHHSIWERVRLAA